MGGDSHQPRTETMPRKEFGLISVNSVGEIFEQCRRTGIGVAMSNQL